MKAKSEQSIYLGWLRSIPPLYCLALSKQSLISLVMLLCCTVMLWSQQSPNGYIYEHDWQYYSDFSANHSGGYCDVDHLEAIIGEDGIDFTNILVQDNDNTLAFQFVLDS